MPNSFDVITSQKFSGIHFSHLHMNFPKCHFQEVNCYLHEGFLRRETEVEFFCAFEGTNL